MLASKDGLLAAHDEFRKTDDGGRGAHLAFSLPGNGGRSRLLRVVSSARLPAVVWQVPGSGTGQAVAATRFDDAQTHFVPF